MTITLTIDNLEALPDGGPTRFSARNRGFEIGREQHLDWTLPDPGRYISGRHCEVRFENGGYWLYDTSTNGVFVNGSSQRVKSPYRLADGDRLSIGHYMVTVALEQDGASPPRAPEVDAPIVHPVPGGDIWSLDEPAPKPVDRREFMPPGAQRREADFSNQFLEFPDIQAPAGAAATPGGIWPQQSTGVARPPQPADKQADPADGFEAQQTPQSPSPTLDPGAMRPMPGPAARSSPVAGAASPPPSRPAGPMLDSGFITAFAAGAGIPVDVLRGRNADEIAFEIGEFVKVSVENLTQLLQARAAAKTMTKSASRTMVSATDNNPLKFVPGTAEAIEVMFARKRPGYLDAKASLEGAFSDLKRHEFATYTAMQKALARLVQEFAPDAIEKKAGSATFALKKSRAWDIFVAKWEEHDASENGLLDTFLAYFAEAYDEVNAKKP